jgi:hypothetical protein
MIRLVRLALSAMLLTTALFFVPTAIAQASVNKTFPVDRVTCAMFLNAKHVHGPDTGCYAVVTIRPFANLIPSADAATSCRGYYEDFYMTNPLTGTLTKDEVNVGLCHTGSTVYRNWGPDCYAHGGLLFDSGSTWCGVYNNGGSFVNPGNNFWFAAYIAPWHKRYGYFRFNVNANGDVTSIWGSCCSG